MVRRIAVLLIFVIITTFAGCGIDKDDVKSDFKIMVAASATPEHIQTTAEFLDQNIPHVGKEDASRMLVAYEEYLHRYITDNREMSGLEVWRPYMDLETKRVDEGKITDSEVVDFYKHLKAGSILVVYYEDSPKMVVDYSNLLEKYGDYILEPLQRLYELDAEAVEKPMAENATLMISWEALLKRANKAEVILKEYPDNELIREDTMWLYKTYLNAILMGTTNTPIFNYSTNTFSPGAKAAYTAFILENPDSTLSWVLKEYFVYLKSINNNLNFNDSTMSKVFFDTCDWLVSEAEKKVLE